MNKQIIKKILPKIVFDFLRVNYNKYKIRKAYYYDYKRYCEYSSTTDLNSQLKLEAMIIRESHIIEKGLTMPEIRIGFGEQKMLSLCNNCYDYITKYTPVTPQVAHAISVIKEYQIFQSKNNFELCAELNTRISSLLSSRVVSNIEASQQEKITKEAYFTHVDSPFATFSSSRKSIRNYSSEEIPLERLQDAFSIALNTPSACNRQTVRTYVYSDKSTIKKILDAQMGAGGFGYLSNKLIVITAELGVFSEAQERYQAYIDGGIYAMNLLYALHSLKIAGCILNCSHTPGKDLILRDLCKIKDSENFIAMISCGIPPEVFAIAISKRYRLEDIVTFK
ncbi:nitroreductase [Orbus hercynius]|uniref:Nitroreductase n=1 Tax=Orbus hercynius TaxID=593135 RepID=A0A495RBY1_9GAMM|nr:nitroreductase family protein [Orbus hercynius]RKS84694.1 nitroreductase [Orbus hercynius]